MDSYHKHPDFDDHESVVFHNDSRLRAIVAVHNTVLGPAVGGCRMVDYAGMDEALTDVLRLSRGMTYKSALAGLPLGGGKSVILGNPHTAKSPDLIAAMGDFINSLGGLYVAAEDSGTCVRDLEMMSGRTPYVAGVVAGEEHGGDPSPVTAYGVFVGIQTALRYRGIDLDRATVAIQGVGNVGFHLAELLVRGGADVVVADVNRENVKHAVDLLGVRVAAPEEVLAVEADVLAPCALGGALNHNSVDRIRAGIVAGAANNQLATPEIGLRLLERGILYVPDYIINAGGVIDVHYQRLGVRDRETVYTHVDRIELTLLDIFDQSVAECRPTGVVAEEKARLILAEAAHSHLDVRSAGSQH